jgi:hypothetical protein
MDVLFQRIYPETMTVEQRTEAYDGYMGLPEKDNIRFRVYTDCFTTLEIGNKDVFKRWYPMSLNRFLDKFGADLGPASTETPTP